MKEYIKVILIIVSVIIVLLFLLYLFGDAILKRAFYRMNFEENKEFLSYNDIKNKIERKEYEFFSSKIKLKGYLYGKNQNKGLVVYVHGMCPGHQGYLSDIISLVNRGYLVFTYDFTATGESNGAYYLSVQAQKYDLMACLDFLKENEEFKNEDIFLYGHSMGAYAVSCNINYYDKVKKIVSISGFDVPLTELKKVTASREKNFISSIIPIPLSLALFVRKGFKFNEKASDAVSKSNKDILIIHGKNDEMVPLDISIYASKDKIKNKNARFILIDTPPHDKHNTIIASSSCISYQKEREKIFNDTLEKTKNRKMAYSAMIKDIDRFKFNEANEELMEIIDQFYQNK